MSILERLGLRKKRARPVGQNLEKSREGPVPSQRTHFAVKFGIIATLVLTTLLAFPRSSVFEYAVQVGEEWQRDDLRAPFSFAVYKAPDTLAAERARVVQSTPPFFREVPDAQEQMTAYRDTVEQQLEHVFEAYESYVYNLERGRSEEAHRDSLRYVQLRNNARPKLTSSQWQILANDVRRRIPGSENPSRTAPQEPPLYTRLLNQAWQLGTQLVGTGVLNVPLDSVHTERIIIRNEQEHTERTTNTEYLYGLHEVYTYASDVLQDRFEEVPARANIASVLFRSIIQPSLQYMRAETLREWQRKQQRISPTRGKVEEGELIVSNGDVVTEEVKRKLTSLDRARAERAGPRIGWRRTLGQLMLVVITYFIFFLYLFLLRRQIFDNNKDVLLVSLLFLAIILLFAAAIRMSAVTMYAVPIAIVSVLLTVMFDSRVGIFGTLTLTLVGAMLLGYDFEFFFASIFGGVVAVFSVRDIKNRGQFFISSGLVFLGYAAVLVASWLFLKTDISRLGTDLLYVAVNSFLLIMAYPLLWIFERAFDITTDLTLLELSDTNRPLLKELSLRAPGSFQHSLQVANMAEAAAATIGANALLARVGALYHDIGKMLKPEYFVENQRGNRNPHDQLKPRMSALIIASHVKEGLEMGRQYNLPRRVLDFIPTHHGTTRIEYFYRRALDRHADEDPDVLEAEFRYPGPRPHTAETGILMLADSVEAASRSLDDPSHKKLDSLIDMIFRARIDDQQLDDCELTFRDLNQIKQTFLSVLLGIHHGRVEYPGQTDEAGPESDDSLDQGTGTPASVNVGEEETSADVETTGVVGVPEQSTPADSIDLGDARDDVSTPLSGEEPTRSPDSVRSREEESIDGNGTGRSETSHPAPDEEGGPEESDVEDKA